MNRPVIFLSILGIIFSSLVSYSALKAQNNPQKLVIAISKERAVEGKKYSEWLSHQQIDFRYTDLSKVAFENLKDSLEISAALLLTGGADIYPGRYGEESDTARCGAFDLERDQFEFKAFELAKSLKMPILGICRGMQLINVASGGTLHIDLPEDTGSGELHREGDEGWTEHQVSLKAGSLLFAMTQDSIQQIASNHHQGIEVLSPLLEAIAFSEDGLIEAVASSTSYPAFFMAVQWHPEWMDKNDPLSGKIAKSFLEAALLYNSKK